MRSTRGRDQLAAMRSVRDVPGQGDHFRELGQFGGGALERLAVAGIHDQPPAPRGELACEREA